MRVAITGLPASGKSTLCKMFASLGAEVIDSDVIAHHLLDRSSNIHREVVGLLGEECLTQGALDRAKIAKKVFCQPSLLHKLEEILHPKIRELIQKRFGESQAPVCLVEVPLLYEVGWEKDFDRVIAVRAPLSESCQWFIRKQGMRYPNDYKERISRHFSQEEKCRRADFVIDNLGTVDELIPKVEAVYSSLVS